MTEQTMLEKCARAIHDAFYRDEDSGAWMSGQCPLDSVTIDGDVNLMKAARAVIDALMEPSPEMVEAGSSIPYESETFDDDIKCVFRAMLIAAKGE